MGNSTMEGSGVVCVPGSSSSRCEENCSFAIDMLLLYDKTLYKYN